MSIIKNQGKMLGILLMLIIFSLIMTACEVDNGVLDPDIYTLTVQMEGEGEILDEDENVILDSEEQNATLEVEEGSFISLTAEPADNWFFIDWIGNGSTRTTTIFVNEDKNLEAIFGTLDIYNVSYERDALDHWVFEGLAENSMNHEINYAEIHIYLYDEDGIRVGSGWTNETDIPPGEIFEWTIYTVTDSEFDYYNIEIKDLGM